MGDADGAASFVLTVVLGAVLLCSSVAISVEQKTFLLIALPYSVAIPTGTISPPSTARA